MSFAIALGIITPHLLSAQSLRLTVLDSASGRVVRGALVSLVDTAGRTVAEGLTGSEGKHVFAIKARARVSLRVRRIGFAPYDVPSPLDVGTVSTERTIAVPFQPVVLPVIVVTASAKQCGAPHELDAVAASMWDQVQTSLRIVQLARDEQPVELTGEEFERTLSRDDKLLSDRTVRSGKTGPRPFTSADPAFLESHGFVDEEASVTTYFGPSVDYLLSPQFEAGHCLTAVAGRDAQHTRVGIAFQPVGGRAIPDIRGTLWLDSVSLRITEVEFTYVGRFGDRALDGAGGYVKFQPLPSGAEFESSWLLRMPRWRADLLHPGRLELAGWTEIGGMASVLPRIRR